MKIKSTQSVIATFLLILATASLFLGMDFRILLGESFVKFAMNGILVLSLIPMLNAGVGINFGLPVGVSAGLVGMCISLNLNLSGVSGFLAAILFSIPVSIIFGSLYGLILNKVKGREDIAATFIGFSFIPLMNFFWTLAPFSNRKMLYPIGGSGLRPRIGLEPYFSQILDGFLLADVGSVEIPFGLLIFYFSIAFLIHMFFKSRPGRRMCAVGENPEFSYFSGTDIDRERIRAVVLSTAIAGVGIVVYAQSYGFIELYNAPLMMAFPAVSALLIGGASKSHTTVFQAIIGTYLFQTIYLLSVPVANELLLPEVSEIIRMIISNGIILYAILKKEGEKLEAKIKNEHFIILFFSVLSVAGIAMSGLSFSFVADQAINRFIRNGLMVLALIIPVKAGMGLNFSITVGAMIAQGVLISAVGLTDLNAASFSMVVVVSIILSVLVGYFIGRLLNMVKGKEMICSIIIGFLANSIYQMIFMVGFGSFIPVKNSEILLSKGIGVRNMIDLQVFRNTLERIWSFNIGRIHIPLFMIVVVILFSLMINYVLNTRFGQKLRAVGLDYQKASSIGIDSESIRIKAIIISTVMASIGHLFYLQNIGMLNVYTGHLKIDIFSCAALLAGGASINDAKVRNALLGLLLFHTLFIVSPQAGQNVFNNSSLGEYFRSFVAYGTIAFALIVNLKENATFDKSQL